LLINNFLIADNLIIVVIGLSAISNIITFKTHNIYEKEFY